MRFIGWATLIVIAALVIMVAVGPPTPTTSQPAPDTGPLFLEGDSARVTVGWVGCREKADLMRALDLAVRQDDIKAAARYTSTHDCRAIDKGFVGAVEDVAAFSHVTCLRGRGEPACYWFPNRMLEKM
jgi:hypothetical protein